MHVCLTGDGAVPLHLHTAPTGDQGQVGHLMDGTVCTVEKTTSNSGLYTVVSLYIKQSHHVLGKFPIISLFVTLTLVCILTEIFLLL
jgi:hypothetical protein